MEEQYQPQRDFKGVWIPKEIWLDERLTALDKIILVEIDSLDITDKGCYASNKYLAKFCQCTETKISTAISKLKELGYIELVSFDGRHRILKSKMQTLKNLKADYKKNKPNNINNNKEKNINNINIINIENLENSPQTENNNSNNIEKSKKKLTKKQENAIECKKILDEFIKDEDIEIQEALKDYLEVRKTKGLQAKQLQIILEDFEKAFTDKSKSIILKQIRNATAGGWLKLVYDNFKGNVKTSYSSKPTFDNTANHDIGKSTLNDTEFNKLTDTEKEKYLEKLPVADMTSLQKEYFNENCLVKEWK